MPRRLRSPLSPADGHRLLFPTSFQTQFFLQLYDPPTRVHQMGDHAKLTTMPCPIVRNKEFVRTYVLHYLVSLTHALVHECVFILVFLVFRRACDGMVIFAALNLHTCHWQGCSRALNPRRSGTSGALVDEPGNDSQKNHWTLSDPSNLRLPLKFERSDHDTL